MTILERADPLQLQVNNVQGTAHPLHSMPAIGWRTPCPVLCICQLSLLPWGPNGAGEQVEAMSKLGYDEMSACLCCLACEGRISTPIFNVMISNPLAFDPEMHPEAFCSGKNTLSITPLKGSTATSPLQRGLLRPASSFLLPPRGSHSAPHCGHPS